MRHRPAGYATTPAPRSAATWSAAIGVVSILAGVVSPPATANTPTRLTVLSLRRPVDGEWMGIYLLGRKAGYSFSQVSEGRLLGRPVVVATEDTTLKATLGGAAVRRRVREEKSYEEKPEGRLILFRALHEGDGGDETIVAHCDPAGVHLVRRRPGQPEERLELPPSEDVVENADLPRLAVLRHATQRGRLFDSSSLRDKTERVDYLGPGELPAAGSNTRVERVKITEDEGKVAAKATLDAQTGRLLRLEFGGALLAIPEPEALAKTLSSVDLFALTRVTLNRTLPSGRVPATIRYQIEGLPADLRPAPERQRYRDLPGGSVELTVRAVYPTRRALRPETGLPPDLQEYLAATPAIESTSPEIEKLSRQIVGREKDALSAADLLSQWVFKSLRKAYGVSSDRATDVLRRREGDCTEHSLLTVALARAAGIPARLVHGLVYAEGSDGTSGLYWHEWVEVWTGEWVAIDPTFGQRVADATHLELGEGDETDAVALMGQLKITVLGEETP